MNLDLIKLCCRACEQSYSDRPALVDGTLESEAFSYGDCHWHVFTLEGNRLLVAFRGTDSIAGWLSDFNAVLVKRDPFLGHVHKGFAEDHLHVWPQIACSLAGRNATGIIYTGHSLGGPRATHCAWHNGQVEALVTFGAPRQGDWWHARHVEKRLGAEKITRVVHEHDLVAQLPPPPLYWHIGLATELTEQGALTPHKVDLRQELVEILGGPWTLYRDALDHPITHYRAALERVSRRGTEEAELDREKTF